MNKHTTILSEFNQNSLAPSERHLEDWIVSHFDQFGDVEHYSRVNADAYGLYHFVDDEHCVVPYFTYLVDRQFKLPYGRPDLIVANTQSVYALEIKKGAITYDVLGQCLRYMYDLNELFNHIFESLDIDDYRQYYEYVNYRKLEIDEFPTTEIAGMVVGHSLQDANIVMVAAACNIKVVTYEYSDEEYSFTHESFNRISSSLRNDLASSRVGLFMLSTMRSRADHYRWSKVIANDRTP